MVQPNTFNMDLKEGLIGVMGAPKTAKTSWLMTAPKPIFHIDADRGLERMAPALLANGITIKQLVPNTVPDYADMMGADIISLPLEMPIGWKGATLSGFSEIVTTLVTTVQMVCQAEWIKTIGYDTGTVIWPWLHQAELQAKQAKTPGRESLLPVEYAAPNALQKALYSNPRTVHKNVIVTNHTRNITKDGGTEVIGITWDGWSKLEAAVDVFIGTRIEQKPAPVIQGQLAAPGSNVATPVATIVRCGWSLESEGKDIPVFSWDGMLDFINGMRHGNVATP